MAEVELSVLSRQCLSGRTDSAAALWRDTAAWSARRNGEGATVSWRFTVEDARIKLRHLYPPIDV